MTRQRDASVHACTRSQGSHVRGVSAVEVEEGAHAAGKAPLRSELTRSPTTSAASRGGGLHASCAWSGGVHSSALPARDLSPE